MRSLAPPNRRLAVASLALCAFLVAIAVPVGATATAAHGVDHRGTAAGPTLSDSQPTATADCDSDGERPAISENRDDYEYVDGLASDGRADWTSGSILRIGATGDCSLAVTNDSATLTAATIDGNRGVLRATVDVGRDGAIRLSRVPVALNGTANATAEAATGSDRATNGTEGPANATASLAVRSRGRENGVGVEVVTRDANGTLDSVQTTAPSGRFFHLTVRFRANGTARVALWPTDDAEPDSEDWLTVRTTANASGNATGVWRVGLDARAYLDDIAIGTAERSGDEDAANPDESDPVGGDDDDEFGFPARPPNDQPPDDDGNDPATGLVLGPFVVVFGFGIFKFAYGLTRFNEQWDAIGSKTPASEVEPADWNVAITRFIGAAIAVGGVLWILSSLVALLG